MTAIFAGGERMRARYLVGADGMHSTVREQAGIGFRTGGSGGAYSLADVRLSGGVPKDEVAVYTSGYDNKSARTVAVRQGERINARALSAMFKQIIADNRAGCWRKLKNLTTSSLVGTGGHQRYPEPDPGADQGRRAVIAMACAAAKLAAPVLPCASGGSNYVDSAITRPAR